MQLLSIETTPSPNCIKLNLNGSVGSKALTLEKGSDHTNAPAFAQQLLAIETVHSVFLINDFITLTRKGSADWPPILAKVADIIGIAEDADSTLLAQVSPMPSSSATAKQTYPQSVSQLGHVEIAVQVFRSIPMQVRATAADGQQARVALPDRFSQAFQRVIQATGANYVAERHWDPYPSSAGSPDETAQLIADEIDSLIDEDELARLEASAISDSTDNSVNAASDRRQALLEDLRNSNWKHRLKALKQIEVTPETFSQIAALLQDEQVTIRRWAAALMGSSGLSAAVEPLCRVVRRDPSAMVRRTAGDSLSDLGDPTAAATMGEALADPSKLVRWRAARFLNEMGDRSVIGALQKAVESEAEFDVRIEMMAAVERIEGGGDTQLPMWQRIIAQN